MKQKWKKALCTGVFLTLLLANPKNAFAGAWENEGGPNQWKYALENGSYASNGWYWIADDSGTTEKCYYFDSNGNVLCNTKTPDGYFVDADGAWILRGTVQTRAAAVSKPADNVPSYGCTYKGEDAGSVKNDWRSADGRRYYFDAEGNAVRGWQYIGGYKYYFDETTCELLQNLDGKLSAASFHLVVDRVRCQITAYAPDGENGYIIPYRTFICSPGNPHTRTPAGSFVTTNQYRWHTLMGPTYGQYCTRVGNTGVLFHSVPGSNMTSYNISAKKYNKLGEPASHGCIRMTVADAKWIFDHCPSGTGVTIGDNLPAPVDRPQAIKIPAGQNWDPTDPAIAGS